MIRPFVSNVMLTHDPWSRGTLYSRSALNPGSTLIWSAASASGPCTDWAKSPHGCMPYFPWLTGFVHPSAAAG